jgi:DNA polymerase III epsilon subunit-like protein
MFIYLDTETTGTGSRDRLCQIAFKTEDGMVVNELFNPEMKITIDAMCVHHITNEMVKGKPLFQGSPAWIKLKDLLESDENVMIAHNAKFDAGMLIKEGITPKSIICTMKLSRFLDENGKIPRYSLQYLRYYLKLNIDARAHDALGDILVLEALFNVIYSKTVEKFGEDAFFKMIDISRKPILIGRMPFGKHKGLKMSQVPQDYLRWLSTTDLDEDLSYTVKRYLK